MPISLPSKEAALDRVQTQLSLMDQRKIIGVIGKPGGGKSTLSAYLQANLPPDLVTVVPMDGYHLSNSILAQLGRSDRKGAPDTFDVAGFASLLKRIRSEIKNTIYYPIFDRSIEESIAGQGEVRSAVKVVIVEGNYLLFNQMGWETVAGLLDESWFVEVDDDKRLDRLVKRHVQFGRSPEAADAWARGTDERNAQLIAQTRDLADYLVHID